MTSPGFIKKFWQRIARKPPVSEEIGQITGGVHIVDLDTQAETEISLGPPTSGGWHDLVKGWSIGERASGADIEIDEPLNGLHLGIYPVGHHIILWGPVDEGSPLPWIARFDGFGEPTMQQGTLYFRVDTYHFRIGRHKLRARLQRVRAS